VEKLRLYIAEDHLVVRDGIKMLINSQPDMEVVGEASDGEVAWKEAIQIKPDVLLMDISMPGWNGIQTTLMLQESMPDIKILILTVHEERAYLRELLEAGASGYILKRSASEELIKAIHSVFKGGIYVDPFIAGKLLPRDKKETVGQEQEVDEILSQREGEVARLISQGYSNKEIASQLEISVKTVETYKYRVMEKLGLRNRADFIRLALRSGWLQEGL
jgi:DNA-binding NarL/FixJ family response regulator